MSIVLLPFLLLPAPELFLNSFHFGTKLEARHCRMWKSRSGEELEFCILYRDGTGFGLMPAVFRRDINGKRHEIWRDRDRGFRLWKLELAELDGDRQPEIALGVFKRTRHDPGLARRLFIYGWDGKCLYARWLGSRLALPLLDFSFRRSPGSRLDHLITIEKSEDGRLRREYRWTGFGFTGVRTGQRKRLPGRADEKGERRQ